MKPTSSTKTRWALPLIVLVLIVVCCANRFTGDDDGDVTAGPPATVAPTATAGVLARIGTPEATTTPGNEDCVARGAGSAAVAYFGEDAREWCEISPDWDFGVTVARFDRCAAKARKHRVAAATYRSVCRYDDTRRWSTPNESRGRSDSRPSSPTEPARRRTAEPARTRTKPARPHVKTARPHVEVTHPRVEPTPPPVEPTPSYEEPATDPVQPDGASGDQGGDGTWGGSGHAGCTWVNSYYRKDGTHVSGYYRC
ncbi:hypothetical protein [Symbioplanes lichenis]|uniref:hypothetical protein n=1 Tax=Symbioplanes lichenis TaxID=1629072 RepID=UPI002738922F|nr:hypothetical protein [Actinoplanes lichenis]